MTKKTKKPAAKKAAKKRVKPGAVCIEVGQGVCGLNVYLNGYRIAGDKPWGGGVVLRRWLVTEEDIKTAMKGRRPDPEDVELV